MLKGKSIILLVLISACASWSCFFRSNSEITGEANKAIRQSEALQNLEKICNDLPILGRLTPVAKSISKQGNMLSYDYQLDRDFNQIKVASKEKLLREGWAVTKEGPDVWEEQIKFEKEKFRIHISYTKFRNENYGVGCEDKSLTR